MQDDWRGQDGVARDYPGRDLCNAEAAIGKKAASQEISCMIRRDRQSRLRILITAGPTIEYLDSVRFLSNGSSGKMGYAIAEAAVRSGHRVVLVSGPVQLRPPAKVQVIHVQSAVEMLAAARRAFAKVDAAVFSAAVCDYRPRKRSGYKRQKSKTPLQVELLPNPDIASILGRQKGRRATVGFALEDHDGRRHALEKLSNKQFDAIILNNPANIGSEMARAECYRPGSGWNHWPLSTKKELARRIVRLVEGLTHGRVEPATRSGPSTKRKVRLS